MFLIDWFINNQSTVIFVRFRKGRRKNEKDAPSPNPDEQREYLVDDYIKDKISDCDLNKLVTLPVGLDYNEWLATHSKYRKLLFQ